jgi:hypothetical protein
VSLCHTVVESPVEDCGSSLAGSAISLMTATARSSCRKPCSDRPDSIQMDSRERLRQSEWSYADL